MAIFRWAWPRGTGLFHNGFQGDEFPAWNPWRELFRDFPPEARARPAVNVHQDDDGVTVTADVPGVAPEDLSIETEGEVLTLAAKRAEPEGIEDKQYHRREREAGEFTRRLRLPAGLDAAKIEAKLADGVLTVRLPKAESARPRKIEIKAG